MATVMPLHDLVKALNALYIEILADPVTSAAILPGS